jgi:hypothetical protein
MDITPALIRRLRRVILICRFIFKGFNPRLKAGFYPYALRGATRLWPGCVGAWRMGEVSAMSGSFAIAATCGYGCADKAGSADD